MSSLSDNQAKTGLAAAAFCYIAWGFMPLVMQAVAAQGPGPWEIVAQRIVWGAVTAGIMVIAVRQGGQVMRVLRHPKTLLWLFISSCLIATNWLVFTWAVAQGKVMDTSLGYYINPLFNMAAGALVFRERLSPTGKIAIGLAAAGVILQGFALGHLPWISLVLALSFGAYGVVRKFVAAEALTGLFLECVLLSVPSLAFIAWLEASGAGHFTASPAATFWIIASGPITALPLVAFAWAMRRMPMSALGFVQFLGPTVSFAIALAQGEPFTPLRAFSFVFIWLGAGVFAWGVFRAARKGDVKLAISTGNDPV